MEVNGGRNAHQIVWSLGPEGNVAGVLCTSKQGGYNDSSRSIETCCGLKTSQNVLKCKTAGNYGWDGGSISIGGKQYCNDASWKSGSKLQAQGIELAGITYLALSHVVLLCIIR